MDWKDVISALLGVSAYTPAKGQGPDLDDPAVERVRETYGGNLAPMPVTRIRWYLADLEAAQFAADAGNMQPAAQLYRALRRDGVISGLLGSLCGGLVRLPKRFYGDEEMTNVLRERNGSRSTFDDMFPPSELKLLAQDGHVLGVGVAELVPVDGRDFPVMIRLEPEFLRYRWNENRWYYQSNAGILPITPGDGRWILHTPGGRIAPWLSGLWPALGRSFINKEHALLHRSNYSAKLANPARVAVSPAGANEEQRLDFLRKLISWGTNTTFAMPPGWDVKLIESKGEGIKVFQEEIDTCDREAAIAIAGQVVTVDGGTGFSNEDVHRSIRSDIIQDLGDSLGYTLNTQGIPQFIASRWGADAITKGAVVEWDVSRPKDLKDEASSMKDAATAIQMLTQVMGEQGRQLNIDEITTRFGIPLIDSTGDAGVPDFVEGPEKPYSEGSFLQ